MPDHTPDPLAIVRGNGVNWPGKWRWKGQGRSDQQVMDNLWRWQARLGLNVGTHPAVPRREDLVSNVEARQRQARLEQLLS